MLLCCCWINFMTLPGRQLSSLWSWSRRGYSVHSYVHFLCNQCAFLRGMQWWFLEGQNHWLFCRTVVLKSMLAYKQPLDHDLVDRRALHLNHQSQRQLRNWVAHLPTHDPKKEKRRKKVPWLLKVLVVCAWHSDADNELYVKYPSIA